MFKRIHSAHSGKHELELFIEGKRFLWPEEYITGLQVKHLAGLPTESELFLAVEPPFKDEPIADEDRVNLARPEVEHFYIKTKLPYAINGENFESQSQYISGKQIRREGKIDVEDEIYLQIPGPWEDELIKDEDFVDLARPGKEKFYSKQKIKEFTLIVNGRPKPWHERKISYEQVVELAFGKVQETQERVYTVTYKHGPGENPEGAMVKGDTVFVKNKMIFNVTATDKS